MHYVDSMTLRTPRDGHTFTIHLAECSDRCGTYYEWHSRGQAYAPGWLRSCSWTTPADARRALDDFLANTSVVERV